MAETKRITKKAKVSKLMDLLATSYLGKIVSIDDPDYIGRCKIMVYGVFGDEEGKLQSIPVDSLPFAYPLHDAVFSKGGSGRFSTPKMDSIVRVKFDGDQYHPRYYSLENIDPDLKALIKDDYTNFHSILFDSEEKLKIYYSQKSGLLLHFDESIINILPDNSIMIQHKNNTSSLEFKGDTITMKTNNAIDITSNSTITHNSNYVHVNGTSTDLGANAIFSAVNGEPLMTLLKALATAMDAKLPLTPGVNTGLVSSAEQLILSKTVKTTP